MRKAYFTSFRLTLRVKLVLFSNCILEWGLNLKKTIICIVGEQAFHVHGGISTYIHWWLLTRDSRFGPGGPAGPKIQSRPGFLWCPNYGCRTHAGFGGSDRKAICIAYWTCEVLERLGLKLGSSDFVRYRSGLGLGFWRMFASLLMTNANLGKVTYVIQLRYFLLSFHTFSYDDLACSSCCFEYWYDFCFTTDRFFLDTCSAYSCCFCTFSCWRIWGIHHLQLIYFHSHYRQWEVYDVKT